MQMKMTTIEPNRLESIARVLHVKVGELFDDSLY